MKILILSRTALDFFKEASEIELSTPSGDWRYFKFSSTASVKGIYENTILGFDAHPDFFKYFLGQFTPKVESDFDIVDFDDFKDFCEHLNFLLVNKKQVLDLSVEQLWIWTVDKKKMKMPLKLKDYLSY